MKVIWKEFLWQSLVRWDIKNPQILLKDVGAQNKQKNELGRERAGEREGWGEKELGRERTGERKSWGESPREMHQDKGRTICGMRFNLRVASATFTPASDGTLFKGEPVTLWWFLPSHLRLQILQKVKIGIFLTFFVNKIYAYGQMCRINITNKCVCVFTENIRFLYHPTTHF